MQKLDNASRQGHNFHCALLILPSRRPSAVDNADQLPVQRPLGHPPNQPTIRPQDQSLNSSSRRKPAVRETGSEIFIQSPSSSNAASFRKAVGKEIGEGEEEAEPEAESVPEEVIITVNVSDWDPDKVDDRGRGEEASYQIEDSAPQ